LLLRNFHFRILNDIRALPAGLCNTFFPQGSVKVPGDTPFQSGESGTRKETPHPPPCGPPSPLARGKQIKTIALSLGERGDRKAVGEGAFPVPSDFDGTLFFPRRGLTHDYCRHFTVNSPRISAKLVSIGQTCPNYFRAMCHTVVCFHTHSNFERHFSNIFFAGSPPDIAESIDKAAHPAKLEVFHRK
jgi:hypothetical protein